MNYKDITNQKWQLYPILRDGGSTLRAGHIKEEQQAFDLLLLRREDPTRTDDPYVPNVVRYQLRYFSIAGCPDFFTL